MTIHLNFKGALELRVKDHVHRDARPADWKQEDRVYTLHRETPGEAALGFRFYKTAPSFEIVAAVDSEVSVKAEIYEL